MKTATSRTTRRRFLQSATALGALSLGPPRSPAAQARKLTTPADFKQRLQGPILSFPTAYTSDFKLDLAGMRKMIDAAVRAGVGVVGQTAGNSMYATMTYDEIKSLTRMMVEATAGRALTIAATGPWWTGQSVDYARFAESIGAAVGTRVGDVVVDLEDGVGLRQRHRVVAAGRGAERDAPHERGIEGGSGAAGRIAALRR